MLSGNEHCHDERLTGEERDAAGAEAPATDGAAEVSTGEITMEANIVVTYELGN